MIIIITALLAAQGLVGAYTGPAEHKVELLQLSTPPQEVVVSDLGVQVTIPQTYRWWIVLGVDPGRAMVVWASLTAGRADILRFSPLTGGLLSVHPVDSTLARGRVGHSQIVLNSDTGEILLLDREMMRIIGLDGRLREGIRLPFVPTAALVFDSRRVLLAGARHQTGSPIHVYSRQEHRLVSHQLAGDEDSADLHPDLVRHGIVRASGELWTLPENAYRLEQWSLTNPEITSRLITVHPAVLHYLSGPYRAMRMVAAQLREDRYLWIFIRLRLRSSPEDSRAERNPMAAQFDGLVEVVDLDTLTIIASRYFPRLQLSGWISGPLGYKRIGDHTIQLVHSDIRLSTGGSE